MCIQLQILNTGFYAVDYGSLGTCSFASCGHLCALTWGLTDTLGYCCICVDSARRFLSTTSMSTTSAGVSTSSLLSPTRHGEGGCHARGSIAVESFHSCFTFKSDRQVDDNGDARCRSDFSEGTNILPYRASVRNRSKII